MDAPLQARVGRPPNRVHRVSSTLLSSPLFTGVKSGCLRLEIQCRGIKKIQGRAATSSSNGDAAKSDGATTFSSFGSASKLP